MQTYSTDFNGLRFSLPSKLILITASIVLVGCSFLRLEQAPPEKPTEIEILIDTYMDLGIISGTVLVESGGNIIYHKSSGYENKALGIFNSNKTAFCIGSVTKPITSTAILKLWGAGELDLNATIDQYFPELPQWKTQVTVKQLLNHTAGIPNWTNFQEFRARPGDFIDDIDNSDILEFLARKDTLDFTPGERFSYSNSGYILLAILIERVSRVDYAQYLTDEIFEPCGMHNTWVNDSSRPMIINKAIGYDRFGQIDDANTLTVGAGGIYATAEDLLNFKRALLEGKLISEEALIIARSPHEGNDRDDTDDGPYVYGHGWVLMENPDSSIFFHDGGFNGFTAMLYIDQKHGHTLVFTTNSGLGFSEYNQLVNDVEAVLHKAPYSLPKQMLISRLISESENEGLNDWLQTASADTEGLKGLYSIDEAAINKFGYLLLGQSDLENAVMTFRLNMLLHPESWNCYDSYGESLLLAGDTLQAAEYYTKSVELNPNNKHGISVLTDLWKKNKQNEESHDRDE